MGTLNDFLVHSAPVLCPHLFSYLWLCWAPFSEAPSLYSLQTCNFTLHLSPQQQKKPTEWKMCRISHQTCVLLVSSQTHGCILDNLCNGLAYFRRVLDPDLQFPAVAISPSLTLFASDPGLVVGQEDFFPIHTSSSGFNKPSSGVQNEPRLN